MNRVPKWLLTKEWLSTDDVIKLLDTAPAALENVFSMDRSEEFGYLFRFVCTFCPRLCKMEFKEYRFENVARMAMRSHLKEHIVALKENTSEGGDGHEDFLTRNNMFKSSKSGKHKLLHPNSSAPKKAKVSKLTSEKTGVKRELEDPSRPDQGKPKRAKSKAKQFTQLKEFVPESQISDKALKENGESYSQHCFDELKAEIPEVKVEVLEAQSPDSETGDSDMQWSDNGVNDRISGETQTTTEHGVKEQETLQYRIATKLFATDRSLWINVDQVLDDIIEKEQSDESLQPEDREKILEGMRRWVESVQIYDHQTITRMHDPLTQAEQATLDSLTPSDWKKLDSAHDSESKLRLTVYARLLLRDYECYPRKLKPRVCKHCNRQYTASTSLYSHLVSLSGIRFWVCSKCKDANKEEATFTRKHSLQYHIMKEVGIPRYRCTQPGCSKTHNHTHHQKSHARQHTGEKHYICEIKGCKGKFSNRNTYSRHLLQYHNIELTRCNELREIGEKEAKLKVYVARLKARERSKNKRYNDNEIYPLSIPGNQRDLALDTSPEEPSQPASPSPTELRQSPNNLESLMRPSAAQLLCGIARDVRNTTSGMATHQVNTDMMGGLNLLATVSKYMNAENCSKESTPSFASTDGAAKESEDASPPKEKFPMEFSAQNIRSEEAIIKPLDQPQPSSIGYQKEGEGSETTKAKELAVFDAITSPVNKSSLVMVDSFGNEPVQFSSDAAQKSKLIKVIGAPTVQTRVNSAVQELKHFSFESSGPTPLVAPSQIAVAKTCTATKEGQHHIPYTPSLPVIVKTSGTSAATQIMSTSKKTVPALQPIPSVTSIQSSLPDMKQQGMVLDKGNTSALNQGSQAEMKAQLVALGKGQDLIYTNTLLGLSQPVYQTAFNPSVPAQSLLDGKPHMPVLRSELEKTVPSVPVSNPNNNNGQNIQLIKMSNSATPVQLRSVSSLSGKTYIVLTSSTGGANRSQIVALSQPQNTETDGTRILPFSDL